MGDENLKELVSVSEKEIAQPKPEIKPNKPSTSASSASKPVVERKAAKPKTETNASTKQSTASSGNKSASAKEVAKTKTESKPVKPSTTASSVSKPASKPKTTQSASPKRYTEVDYEELLRSFETSSKKTDTQTKSAPAKPKTTQETAPKKEHKVDYKPYEELLRMFEEDSENKKAEESKPPQRRSVNDFKIDIATPAKPSTVLTRNSTETKNSNSNQTKKSGSGKKNRTVAVVCVIALILVAGAFLVWFGFEHGIFYSAGLFDAPLVNDQAEENNNGAEQDGIPANAVSYNGHRYYAYSLSDFSDWNEVEEFCADKNGHPLTISSQEENDFVYNYISENYPDSNVYMGLVYDADSGLWNWTNGDDSYYQNWGYSEDYGEYAVFSPENTDGSWKVTDFISGDGKTDVVYIESVEASSVKDEEYVTHYGDRICDNDILTAWVEGVDGNGNGESVTLYFDKVYTIDEVAIYSGYQKSHELYLKNNRPKKIELIFPDGTSQNLVLDDVDRAQYIKLDTPVSTDEVVLKIKSVYPGSDYRDTAVSEINFLSHSKKNYFICEWEA